MEKTAGPVTPAVPAPPAAASPACRATEILSHLAELRNWCAQRCGGDPHLTDDIVQETVLIALRRLADLRNPRTLRCWLFQIAKCRLADVARHRRPELPLTIEPVAPSPFDPPDTDRAKIRRVRRALRRLPAFLRIPVRLHYMKGRPLREVALSLHTTVNGIKARLYRARRILREEAAS